jgi:hypothetical protein
MQRLLELFLPFCICNFCSYAGDVRELHLRDFPTITNSKALVLSPSCKYYQLSRAIVHFEEMMNLRGTTFELEVLSHHFLHLTYGVFGDQKLCFEAVLENRE